MPHGLPVTPLERLLRAMAESIASEDDREDLIRTLGATPNERYRTAMPA